MDPPVKKKKQSSPTSCNPKKTKQKKNGKGDKPRPFSKKKYNNNYQYYNN